MNDTSHLIDNSYQFSITQHAWNWYNILSNLLCVIPTIQFIKDNNYYDAIIIFGTGLSSFLYHINNNTPTVYNNSVIDKSAIQLTDAVMSYILIFQITTYLAFYKNYYTRSIFLFIFLPFEIYNITMDELYNLYFLAGVIFFFILYIIYNLHSYYACNKKKIIILLFALTMSAIEILMYAHLQKTNYNAYHSIHHTLAFFSIIFYFYIPKSITIKKTDYINSINVDVPTPNRNKNDNIQLRIHYELKSPSPRK